MLKKVLVSTLIILSTIGCSSKILVANSNGLPNNSANVNALSRKTSTDVLITKDIYNNKTLPFVSHIGEGAFDSTLAMNVQYQPILNVRSQMEKILNRKLDFFKGWSAVGEAHITTVTPVEFYQVLKKHLSMKEIDEIAKKNNIQDSKLEVLGVGSGKLEIEGKMEETFFVIVKSENLFKVRREIQKEFVKRGGNPKEFNSEDFYPHITIAYTKRDLHITDGVYKDIRSLDPRFNLIVKESIK